MLRNHLKIAYRNIWKDRVYSAINITGLALATAIFLLIIHYVRFEHSYEDIHTKADNIYRVTLDIYNGAEYVTTDCETYPVLGPTMLKDMPEVKNYARIEHVGNTEVKSGEKGFIVDKVYAADSQYFSLFNIDLIEGNKSRALTRPDEVMLSENTAKKIFGKTSPVGKVLQVAKFTLTVTGVFKDIPENTHLKFDLLIPFSLVTKTDSTLNNWSSNNNFTYVELVPGASPAALNQKLLALSKQRLKDEILTAGPIKDIHLYSKRTYEPEPPGNAGTVKFLLLIAILILVIGSVNYVNLTTARSSERLKEAGIRKVLGSTRLGLVYQFFLESLLINLAAFILALVLVYVFIPFYLQIVGKPLDAEIFHSPSFWTTCVLLFGLNCLLSGLQPAIMLSAVKPVVIMSRSSNKGGARGSTLRRTLVVGQFAVATVVIAFTLVIYRQLQFMRQQDKGMDIEQILVINDLDDGKSDSARVSLHQAMRNDLLKLPAVKEVSLAGALPGVDPSYMNTTNNVALLGSEKNGYNFSAYAIDSSFIPLLKMTLLAGRNFSNSAANANEVLLNEESCRLLGFSSPEKAIGQVITYHGKTTVIGVVKNFNQLSVKEAQLPMINYYIPHHAKYIAVKINTREVDKVIAAAEKTWLTHYPGRAFDYFFLDQLYNRQYKSDVQFGQIISVFSFLTVFITCLGLLGLTAHNIARRTKEIGIRKVLGASAIGIVQLFAKDYVKLVLIAMVIGIPVAIWAEQQWLQDFAARAAMPWWLFALAGGAILLIALITVSLQSVKAALANPADSLASE
ncbi:ABC transporter permease [Chitinophaga niabensis]|uniref:Putative ABC transport system permease protein n=1 Tax=Chitinophaga niabensis TaxID=536979 RepID=A0A1N6DU95_9BACT|nr:ABC transporter permease [Chitinophaga niabensis]SIN74310.1 putative ABC transport system permease protein [Chitinophaga niabensis]